MIGSSTIAIIINENISFKYFSIFELGINTSKKDKDIIIKNTSETHINILFNLTTYTNYRSYKY